MNSMKRKSETTNNTQTKRSNLEAQLLRLETVSDSGFSCGEESASTQQESDNGGSSDLPVSSNVASTSETDNKKSEDGPKDPDDQTSESTDKKLAKSESSKPAGTLLFFGGTNWDLIGRKELPKNDLEMASKKNEDLETNSEVEIFEKQLPQLEQHKTADENILCFAKSQAASSSTVACRATCVAGSEDISDNICPDKLVNVTSPTSETNVSTAVAEQHEYIPKEEISWPTLILRSNIGETVRPDMTVRDFCSQIDIAHQLSKIEVIENRYISSKLVYDLKESYADESFIKLLEKFSMFYAINVYDQMDPERKSEKSCFMAEIHEKCPPIFTVCAARFFPKEVTQLSEENVINFLTTMAIISIFQRYRE